MELEKRILSSHLLTQQHPPGGSARPGYGPHRAERRREVDDDTHPIEAGASRLRRSASPRTRHARLAGRCQVGHRLHVRRHAAVRRDDPRVAHESYTVHLPRLGGVVCATAAQALRGRAEQKIKGLSHRQWVKAMAAEFKKSSMALENSPAYGIFCVSQKDSLARSLATLVHSSVEVPDQQPLTYPKSWPSWPTEMRVCRASSRRGIALLADCAPAPRASKNTGRLSLRNPWDFVGTVKRVRTLGWLNSHVEHGSNPARDLAETANPRR